MVLSVPNNNILLYKNKSTIWKLNVCHNFKISNLPVLALVSWKWSSKALRSTPKQVWVPNVKNMIKNAPTQTTQAQPLSLLLDWSSLVSTHINDILPPTTGTWIAVMCSNDEMEIEACRPDILTSSWHLISKLYNFTLNFLAFVNIGQNYVRFYALYHTPRQHYSLRCLSCYFKTVFASILWAFVA